MSRVTDQDDRDTVILFGDGAGAVVVDAVDGPGQLLSWDLGSDGSLKVRPRAIQLIFGKRDLPECGQRLIIRRILLHDLLEVQDGFVRKSC